jgi:uncharacterized protein (TIGR00255 family)
MASSMTGLGTAEIQYKNSIITIDVKSFNNRFLEISCRLAPSVTPYEKDIKNLIRRSIQRGKVYLNVSVQGDEPGDMGLRVNTQKIRAIRQLLEEVQKIAGIHDTLNLEHFLKFSEILEPGFEPDSVDEMWDSIRTALEKALSSLKKMREEEGEALAGDMIDRIEFIRNRMEEIEGLSKRRIPETFQRMQERVRQLIQDAELDENRLHLEVALLSDRMDVTEECVRLKSHCQLFVQTFKKKESIGKKLTFLLQEMNREVNTICAKANDAEIGHFAVEMKEEIEKLREQVQNLE